MEDTGEGASGLTLSGTLNAEKTDPNDTTKGLFLRGTLKATNSETNVDIGETVLKLADNNISM